MFFVCVFLCWMYQTMRSYALRIRLRADEKTVLGEVCIVQMNLDKMDRNRVTCCLRVFMFILTQNELWSPPSPAISLEQIHFNCHICFALCIPFFSIAVLCCAIYMLRFIAAAAAALLTFCRAKHTENEQHHLISKLNRH